MNEFERRLKEQALNYKSQNPNNISINDMKAMQESLRQIKGWNDTAPEFSKDHLLNMIGEVGEVASIFKKKGINKCMTDPQIRAELIEELADVEMYFIEVLNRLKVSPQEFSQAYIKKYQKNIGRNYAQEWKQKIVDETEREDK